MFFVLVDKFKLKKNIFFCHLFAIMIVSVDEIQVASYKMLGSLYALGTDATLTHDRKYLKTEIERHKPALVSSNWS